MMKLTGCIFRRSIADVRRVDHGAGVVGVRGALTGRAGLAVPDLGRAVLLVLPAREPAVPDGLVIHHGLDLAHRQLVGGFRD